MKEYVEGRGHLLSFDGKKDQWYNLPTVEHRMVTSTSRPKHSLHSVIMIKNEAEKARRRAAMRRKFELLKREGEELSAQDDEDPALEKLAAVRDRNKSLSLLNKRKREAEKHVHRLLPPKKRHP